MNKIKILYLIPTLRSGGAERQLIEILKNLDKKKYQPILVLIYSYKDIDYKEIFNLNISIRTLNKKKGNKLDILGLIWRLRKLIISENPDIIHSYLNLANLYSRLSSLLISRKIITSIRSIMPLFWLNIEKLLHRRSDLILTNSEIIKKQLVSKIGVQNKKVYVVYNGIDINRFRKFSVKNSTSSKFGINTETNHFIILMVAQFYSYKNHMCLLKAFKMLIKNKNLPKYPKLIFIGKITEIKIFEEVKEFVRINHLSEQCTILEPINKIEQLYNIGNVLVLPSFHEGFPNVVLEAMACELPVIVSEAANTANIIVNNDSGFVFKNNNYIELSKLLRKVIMMDPDKLAKIAKNARITIEDKYTSKIMTKKIEEMYISILSKNE